MRKQIKIDQGHVEGYGGPGYHWARLTSDNLLLEEFKGDRADIAVKVHEAKKKWSKNWSDDTWSKATKAKKPASPLCSVCGGDTLDGRTLCVDMTFCRKCQPRIEEFKKKYHDAVEAGQRESALKQQAAQDEQVRKTGAALAGAFHWKDGWFFKRVKDGSVRIMRPESRDGREEYLLTDVTVKPNEWASIVCSVSAEGETGPRWEQAQDFHGRE